MVYVNRKTRDWLGRALVWVIVGAAAFAAFGVMQDCLCAPVAEAEEAQSASTSASTLPLETSAAILKLQPALTPAQNETYAAAINASAARHGFDPLILVVTIMRESSFNEHARGSAGEIGLMQVMPGVAARFAPDGCDVENDPTCNIATGAAKLADVRDRVCPGSTWRWMAGYGMKRCPSEREAGLVKGARRAFHIYTKLGGTRW